MNVKLGKYNQLEVVKEVDFGVYLDGGDDGEILSFTILHASSLAKA